MGEYGKSMKILNKKAPPAEAEGAYARGGLSREESACLPGRGMAAVVA